MAGEVNLRKLKEVAQRLGIERKPVKRKGHDIGSLTLFLTHEYMCDMPDTIIKEELENFTGSTYFSDKEQDS